jgi:hypothetical protein
LDFGFGGCAKIPKIKKRAIIIGIGVRANLLTPISVMIGQIFLLFFAQPTQIPNPKITYLDYRVTTTYRKAIKILGDIIQLYFYHSLSS